MRIELTGKYADEWIELRDRRGWAATKRIDGAVVRIDRNPDAAADDEAGYSAGVDLLNQALAKLETSLVAWSFDAVPGRAYYLGEDFDGELGEQIIDAIDEFYARDERTDEERKT